MHSSHGITFDRKGSRSFGDDCNKNIVIFGVDTSSSSHINHHKNKFLVLGEGYTFGTDGSFGAQKKN